MRIRWICKMCNAEEVTSSAVHYLYHIHDKDMISLEPWEDFEKKLTGWKRFFTVFGLWALCSGIIFFSIFGFYQALKIWGVI